MSARHADDRTVPTHADGSIDIPAFAERLGRPVESVRAVLARHVPAGGWPITATDPTGGS